MSPCGIAGDVPASALAEIVQAWRIANQCFEVQAGRSSLPGPVQLQPLVASAAKPKKRCLPPAFLLRKTCRSKVPRLVAVVVPEHERTKRDQQIQAMYDIVVATGSANLRFSPTELGTAEVMPLFVRLLDKVSDARLSALFAALKRWVRFAECHMASDVPYWKPSAVSLASFLQGVAQAGPLLQ